MTPQITWTSWAMIAILGLIWGSTFMVIEFALMGMTPIWVAAARIIFAAPILAGFWAYRGKPLTDTAARLPVHYLIINAAFSFVMPFCLIAWGQQYVTSGFVGISMSTVPIWLLPMAHFFVMGEQLTLRRMIGVTTGFIGVLILIGPGALRLGTGMELWGQLACLGAAFCYGIGAIVMRRLPPCDPIALAGALTLISAVMIVPVAFAIDGRPALPTGNAVWALVVLGLVPTAFATLLRVYVIRTAGPTFMTLTNFQVPLWSVFLGMWILNEPASATIWLALALVLLGLGISQFGALTRLFATKRERLS